MAMTAWKGGEIPVSRYADVRVRTQEGESIAGPAGTFDWEHGMSPRPHDIVAYEVLGTIETPPLDRAGLADSQEALTFGPAWAMAVAATDKCSTTLSPHTGLTITGSGAPYQLTPSLPEGNTDAGGEGKQTNPKDVIGSRKAKLSVIPAPVLFDIGLAMTEGMCKYGRHNYRIAGVRSSVYYDAAMGHLMDWWEGQDIDPDSGLSHVTKALASLTVLRDAMFQQKLIDDRPPRSRMLKEDFSPLTADIIDRHKDKSPRHFTIADTQEAS